MVTEETIFYQSMPQIFRLKYFLFHFLIYVKEAGIEINMAANAFFIQHFLNFLWIYSFDLLFWIGLCLVHPDISLGWVWTAYSTQGCLFFNLAIHWQPF